VTLPLWRSLQPLRLVVYGGIVLMLFGSDWIAAFRGKRRR
jgi:hypothetical protein